MAACTLHWPTVPQAPQWLPLLASALALAKACLRCIVYFVSKPLLAQNPQV